MKNPETEARIDALSENPPEFVTPEDIAKARKAARKAYREDLTNAVKRELMASPVNMKEIIEAAMTDIVGRVSRQVAEKLKERSADNRIDAEVRSLVADQLKKFKPNLIAGVIEAEIESFVKEMVAKNVVVSIKGDHW